MASIRETLQQVANGETNELEQAPASEAIEASPDAGTQEDAPQDSGDKQGSGETKGEAGSRARDEGGRFSKQAKEAAQEVAKSPAQAKVTVVPGTQAGSGGQGTTPSAPPVEAIRPPQSLTPQEREFFNKAPVEIQKAIVRREKEMAQGLQEAVEPKRFHQQFQQMVNPYLGMIQAEGGEPLKAVASLLQTAAALRTAPPAHKAQIVARMVKQFGVPLEELASAIDGQPMQPGQGQQQQQYVDPNAIAQQVIQTLQQARQHTALEKAKNDVQAFGEKHEFFEDVKPYMKAIMDASHEGGVELTLEQAYDKACMIHPGVSPVFQQRQAAKAAATSQVSAQRAKAAASSVKSQPSGTPTSATGRSVRDVLMSVDEDMRSR